MKPSTFKILHTDGKEQLVELKPSIGKVTHWMGYPDACLDTVNLRDGRVMFVHDDGVMLNLPVNAKATKLYHSVCYPGTTNQIHGNVAIVCDEDFE